MDSKDIQLKILAQAIYELRLLLSNHLGSKDESSLAEAIAAHIAQTPTNQTPILSCHIDGSLTSTFGVS